MKPHLVLVLLIALCVPLRAQQPAPPSQNQQACLQVRELGLQLVRANNLPGNWSFVVAASPEVNAYTPSKYTIIVTEGLIALGLSRDELAGVLAHEIAHSIRGHLDHEQNQQRQLQLAMQEFDQAQRALAQHLRDDPQIMRANLQLDRYETRFLALARTPVQADVAAVRMAMERFEAELKIYSDKVQEQEVFNKQRCASSLTDVRRLLSSARRRIQSLATQSRLAGAQQRNNEMDADLTALRVITRGGFSTAGLVSALEKVGRQGGSHFGLGYHRDAATHPSIDRRLEVLRRALRR